MTETHSIYHQILLRKSTSFQFELKQWALHFNPFRRLLFKWDPIVLIIIGLITSI